MRGSRHHVALLIETSNSYAREVLHGIREWMRRHERWSVRLSEQGRGAEVPRWIETWRGDGIIARVESGAIAEALRATKLPVVDVSAALETPVFPRVATDSRAVTELAAEHLLRRGFRHFGYCGAAQFQWSVRRAEFFQAALARTGYGCDVFDPAGSRGRRRAADSEVAAIARWLETLPKPAGVLACYDLRGQEVLEACRLSGLRVPDEVAVIGVHNDELLCDLCEPPLSSVMPNARRAGQVAAELLARLMAGKAVAAEDRLIAPVGVAARQSTDVVAVPDEKVAAAVRFVRDNLGRNIAVRDVLRAVPVSRTLLERKFKECLGCTPHEHIARARLERAKTLLATTDLSIAEIAERLGMEHPEYLSVAFRRETGMPPGKYRARHRAG